MVTGFNHGDQFIMYINVKSLFCIPKTNLILRASYISIKNIKGEIYKWLIHKRKKNKHYKESI